MVAVDEILRNIYFNPAHPAAYGSINKLYNAAKNENKKISIYDVKDWLSGQDEYTLFRSVKRKFKRSPVRADYADNIWQMDTADVKHLQNDNDGIKFLFIIIDVFDVLHS